jgi:hypothetical protein
MSCDEKSCKPTLQTKLCRLFFVVCFPDLSLFTLYQVSSFLLCWTIEDVLSLVKSVQWKLYNLDELEIEDVLEKLQHDDSLGKGGTNFLNSWESCLRGCWTVKFCKGALMILFGGRVKNFAN